MKNRSQQASAGRSWFYGFVIMLLGMLLFSGAELKADDGIDLWPLLESSEDTTTVCYPIYTHEGNFKMILNFYAQTNNGKDHHIMWPFVKLSDGELERVFPFWFRASSNDFVFFPFMVQTPEYSLWTVPPVYMRKDGDFKAVFPFYVQNKDSLYIFPNVFVDEDRLSKSVEVFPFYSYSRKKVQNSVEQSLRIGNYYSTEDFERTSVAFFPFYSANVPKDPRANSSLYLLPYYKEWNEERNYSKTLLLPFYASKSSEEESYTWLLNYYNYKSESKSTFNVFPFYGESEEEDYHTENTKESLWVIWPIYSREREVAEDGSVVAKNNRFLIFSNKRERSGKRTFSVLGQVITERVN